MITTVRPDTIRVVANAFKQMWAEHLEDHPKSRDALNFSLFLDDFQIDGVVKVTANVNMEPK